MSISRLDASAALGPEILRLMVRLPLLNSLTLRQCGFRTLPQLRPLTVLSSLSELSILESPVAKLVLFRPFVAALLPRVVQLNGEAQDAVARQSGVQCIAPLLQELWDVAPDGAAGDASAEAVAKVDSGSWGLSSVAGQLGANLLGSSGTASCSEAPANCGSGSLCSVPSIGQPKQQWRHLVEDCVDMAVARAVDVERRWRIMEECWDTVIYEVLEEWTCFSS